MDWRAARLARDIVGAVAVVLFGFAASTLFIASPFFIWLFGHVAFESFPEPNSARICFHLSTRG